MAEIALRGITRRFGETTVLDGFDLTVRDGEFLSLLGPSGCGKSTLLRLIAGLDQPDGGSIALDGRDITALAPKQRDVAMVFQNYALYPYMTVAENIALPLEMRRLSPWQRLPLIGRFWPGTTAARADIAAEVRRAAVAGSIAHLLNRKPAQLSGGQRQRVALARALVRHPAAFLLDEPLSNLDAGLRDQMREEIAGLHRRLGATFVYVTHDQDEALALSDRVAVMIGGRLLQLDTPRALYENPSSLAVARFIGQPRLNLLPGRVDAAGRVLLDGATWPIVLPSVAGQTITIGIRPDALHLHPSSGSLRLAARLIHAAYRGIQQEVHFETATGEHLIALATSDQPIPAAGPSAVHFSLNDVLLFGSDGGRIALPTVAATGLREVVS